MSARKGTDHSLMQDERDYRFNESSVASPFGYGETCATRNRSTLSRSIDSLLTVLDLFHLAQESCSMR